MTEKKTSWMHMMPIHLPESTSEMFVYQPQGDVDSMWMTVTLDWDFCPLRVELFTPDDGELGIELTSQKHNIKLAMPEGSCLDLEFVNIPQRDAFFRMILELADWIKEHHHGDLPTV